MAVPILDLSEQHATLADELRAVFDAAVQSGAFILGPMVEQFEQQLAAYCGVRHAVGVSSGTDALLAALMALDVQPGDEVITSTFSFFASAGSIARLGATPVFVDVDPATFNLDPDQVAAAVTPRTVAVMPVHLFGLTAAMDAISDIAARHGLAIVEDAAQAIGARHRDRPAGAMGDVGCLSFFPTKNLGALGDAGACLTSDDALAEKLRLIRVHGSGGAYRHDMIGGNFRIDALQAGMLAVKLRHLDDWIAARRAHADRYHAALPPNAGLVPPTAPPEAYHTWNQYTLRVPDGRRDALAAHLSQQHVGCRVYYPLALHLQPCFAYLGGEPGRFPIAERLTQEVLSLPVYPELTQSQQDEVIAAVKTPLAASRND